MPRTLLTALVLCLGTLTAGCQIGQPAAGSDSAVTPNAVAGGTIEVTALDGPVAEAGLATPTPVRVDEPVQGAPEATASEAIAPQGAESAEADAEQVPEPEAAAEVPAAQKSELQIACERRNGRWASTGMAGLRTCLTPTRDSGKQCSRESQCDGVCLARSGTCAPVKPLLGCHEILQDDGARVTLCIE